MILLAFLALLQVCVLPGWLALRPFSVQGGLTRALLVFTLSLLVNSQLVGALTLLDCYSRPVVLAIMALEGALAAWLAWRFPKRAPAAPRDCGVRESVGELPRALPLRHALLTLAWLCLAWVAAIWLQKIPGVFGIGDDLVSWNRWALSWAEGKLPQRTGYYPQLIPANWSLIYLITGAPQVHAFAKAMMGLFAIGLLAVPLAAFRFTRSVACLGAVPILAWMLHRLLGLYIGEGYVDIPLAFFFAATWLVITLGFARQISAFETMVLSTLTACAALLTKQGAAYLFIATLVFNAVLLWRERAPRAAITRAAAVIALAAAVLIAPWYLRQWQLVSAGRENSEWEYQTEQLHAGRSLSERVARANAGIIGKLLDAEKSKPLTRTALALFALLAVAAWRNPAGRTALLLGVPYYLLWAALFSYDRRNVAAALPFLALVISAGALEVAEWLARRRESGAMRWLLDRRAPAALGASAVAVVLIALHTRYDGAFFLRKQDELIRQVGYAEVNRRLYEFEKREGISGAIVTDYQQLGHLPGLSGYYRPHHFGLGGGVEALLRRCASSPAARHVLLPAHAPAPVSDYAERNFERVFQQTPYTFYRIPASALANSIPPEK
jgi:hypothetical protein